MGAAVGADVVHDLNEVKMSPLVLVDLMQRYGMVSLENEVMLWALSW